MSPQQLFASRRKALRSGAVAMLPAKAGAGTQSFAAVALADEDNAGTGGPEIVIGDATIRVGSSVAPALLLQAIRAVRAA